MATTSAGPAKERANPTGQPDDDTDAKEVVRQTCHHTDVGLADEWVTAITTDFCDPEMPPEVRRLGRTIGRWLNQIVAWHRSHVTNGPTEAVNNLAKRIKRVAFGLTNFRHHRI